MKKYILLIILGVAALLLAFTFLGSLKTKERAMDERITLRIKDKIPYGMYVAYTLLHKIFPDAIISHDQNSPGNWDGVSSDDANRAVVLIAKDFDAEEYELNRLYSFAKNGNYVFIIAHDMSYEAAKFFNCSDNGNFYDFDVPDSLKVNLLKPPFAQQTPFVFPGKRYESFFSKIDTAKALVLGQGNNGSINFIRMKAGTGAIYIHLAPLAFSNYFLLHKNNIGYYKNALSVIPQNVSAVVWNDYYLTKLRVNKERDPGWFRVLLKYPAFRWGLLTAMGTLLLFVLLEMRRKQRMIPEWNKPKNDSMDFVKTIGRLYFDKGDHKNLAKKMGNHFLEHIRSQYKLSTHTIDEDFITSVHNKTAYPLEELKHIVSFIQFTNDAPAISESQLSDFHKQLELFYQNT
jgi:hypothetical protein